MIFGGEMCRQIGRFRIYIESFYFYFLILHICYYLFLFHSS